MKFSPWSVRGSLSSVRTLGSLGSLGSFGLLGMNRRNVEYIARWNKRSAYPLVDDKLVTKRLALEHNVAVPELYGVIEMHHQARSLETILGSHQDFALKPAKGSGGEGIIVIVGRYKERFRKPTGVLMTKSEIEDHISRVIGGVYSLGGQPDKVILEYRVQFDPVFDSISYLGVPDVRIIVFRGIPVMAMVRLPTRMSDGKANLHKGAVGAGIDLRTGHTLRGVWKNTIIEEHPDTGHPVSGTAIPGWNNILTIASGCYEMTKLGYLGVDIVLDKNEGPLLLELNARPGLSIQIANRAGLMPRLEQAEAVADELTTSEARVAFALAHFGAETTPQVPSA